jgi:hypothetical protein
VIFAVKVGILQESFTVVNEITIGDGDLLLTGSL